MSASKSREAKAFSLPPVKNSSSQHITRFTWHTQKNDGNTVLQPKVAHQQPLRFFGSNSHLWYGEPGAARRELLKDEMVKWENTFNMRAYNLNQFNTNNSYRSSYRSQAVALQRARMGFTSGTSKSLDLLRQNLQKSINKEIDEILQKYLKKFFRLAIENIKRNNGEQAVSDQHVQTVCKQILEEAKKMYETTPTVNNSPSPETSEVEPPPIENKPNRITLKITTKKRKDSDTEQTDSDVSFTVVKPKKKKKGRPALHYHGNLSGRMTPIKNKDQVKHEGPKWDPARITSETLFIMGAKANKALGLGATRGRLYIKHRDVYKYSGDQEDKQWLFENGLMPATGGKAYLLITEDIKELAESDEYKNNPALMADEIVGFTVPEFMLEKMRISMQQMRGDNPSRRRGRPHVTNNENSRNAISKTEDENSVGKCRDSRTGTPTDELDLLPSADHSPFSLGTGFGEISPSRTDVSPSPSDMSATLEPPMTAPFEVTASP